MARPLVCARHVLLALACALGPSAAAEVNYSLHVGTRVWEGDVTVFELGGGLGAQHQFDFGPAAWDWRPELALAGGGEILGDNGQSEFAFGVARRWRKDDTELRLSAGAVRLEAHDDQRKAWVSGAYLQATLLWHLGQRFGLGVSARAGEVEDAVVSGVTLPNDYRQLTVTLNWRFGD